MRHPDPGQNQEPCVVSHEADVAPPRLCRPAYVAIAAAQMTRRRTPCHAGDGSSLRPHQILQVLSHWLLVTEIVMMLDEAVEQRFVGCSSDLLKRDRTDVDKCTRQRRHVDQDRLLSVSLYERIERGLTNRRQFDLACAVQHQQKTAADHIA